MLQWIFGRFAPVEKRPVQVTILFSLVMLAARVFVAQPFWLSGQTRWVEFPTRLSQTTKILFEHEFMLHFGLFTTPIPFAGFVGFMTGLAEVILPVLLIIGIGSRVWALGLLAMTVVIELVFPDAWPIHIQWAIAAALIVYAGPGLFSLDAVVRRYWPGLGGENAMPASAKP